MLNSTLLAQTTSISGVINTVSARIDQVSAFNSGDVDSVHVNTVSGFSVGDTVLIHMSVGAEFNTTPVGIEGTMGEPYNSGIYAIFLLQSIDIANSLLILNSTLPPDFDSMVPGESGQILKVPTYHRARISNLLTCNPYDPVTRTGGILVLMVQQALVFDADINVDGKGFLGAVPDAIPYNNNCSSSDPKYMERYLASTDVNFSALKGGGPVITTNDKTRGFGFLLTAGGGGNGKFSGGGGGANYADGGKGGFESALCGSSADIGGKGGRTAFTFYYTTDNRINFGGGGGTSLQTAEKIATAGGNGGGIVIIVCDSLIGKKKISARGQTVTAIATAGGGGGGGGGAVILHVNKYFNSPDIDVSGGDGGSISSSNPEASGPGGGGGSGIVWHNGTTMGSLNSSLPSKSGTYKSVANGAFPGTTKPSKGSLIIPIRGFLFNYIPQADSICKNSPPQTISASPPVGGTGVYTINWLQSIDGITWADAAGKRDTITYTPPPGTNITMHYKRAVNNAGFIRDTSNVSTMFVMPEITNNSINPDTTVCQNLNAGTLYTTSTIGGGNGSYRYKWIQSLDGSFSTIDSVGPATSFVTPVYSQSTWYRRIAYSGPMKTACVSTSNTIKVNVLPAIANNIIDTSQEICIERTPDLLVGRELSGGEGAGTYTYKWQKNISGSWSDTVTTATFQPEQLFKDQQYRRIVISGLNNTCKDTSAVVSISVMDSIAGNTINAISQNILCSGLAGDILTANLHTGGNGVYRYFWQKNSVNAIGGDVENNFSPGILTSTSSFVRIICSGSNPDSLQRCHSTSNIRTITVLENITNNKLSPAAQTVWCEGKNPEDISGLIPLNGQPGSYNYSWQRKFDSGNWTDTSVITKDLFTPVLIANTSYRRVVKSGLNETCKDTSNIITFTMQDSILNNHINGNLPVYVCFDEDSVLLASTAAQLTGGDNTNYAFQWSQSNTLNGIYAELSGQNNETIITTPVQTARYYKRRVVSGDCISYSLAVLTDPLPLPELTDLSLDVTEICYNQKDWILSASVQSGSLPYLFTFSDGLDIDSRTFTTGTQSIEPVIDNPPLDPGFFNYTYNVVSISDSKGCLAKSSNLAGFSTLLKVYTTPIPQRISAELEESCSNTLQISVTPSIGIPSWHLTQIKDITVDNINNPEINLTASYITNSSASVSLAYVEDIAKCSSDTIHVNAILYNSPDTIKNIYRIVDDSSEIINGDLLTIFITDNQIFNADPIVYGSPSWTVTSGTGELSNPTALTTTLSKLEQDDPAFLKYSISNGTCPPEERTIQVERKELLVYDGFSPNNDGINDVLWAVGLADEEVTFKMQIFSSSGNFIREILRKDIVEVDVVKNQVVIWDGTTSLGGADNYIPEGTYYYVLIVDYHGQNFDKKGFILVKR